MDNFDRAFQIIVGEEAGYVNNPDDPGGETNWGVTAQTLKAAIAQGLLPPTTTVKTLTQDQAKIVYRALYWNPIKGDQIAYPLCVFVMDSAINQGVQPAIKMMQRALNRAQDGVLGHDTMDAAAKATPWHSARFMTFRDYRYHSTRNFDKFGEGWITRLFEVTLKTVLD